MKCKQGKLYKLLQGILLLSVILLSGCGKTSEKPQEMLTEMSLQVCIDSTGKTYYAEYKDSQITPDYLPGALSFYIGDEYLYFKDNTDIMQQGIGRMTWQKDDIPQILPLDLAGSRIDAFAVYTENEETEVFIVGEDVAGSYVASYSLEGKEIWKSSFDEQISEFMRTAPIFQMVVGEEGIYAISAERIFLFDRNGVYQGDVECLGKSFVDICCCGNEGVYVTYYGTEGTQIFLSQVQFQTQKLTNDRIIMGNGMLYPGKEKTFLICDGTTVYSCEPSTERIVKLFSMSDYNITNSDLQTMCESDSGEIVAISWELLNRNSSVDIQILKEGQAGSQTEDGKRVVKLLCYDMLKDLLTEDVVEFNKQSKEYRVELIGMSAGGNTLDEMYSGVNTYLAAQESADILYMLDYCNLLRYQSKGYLEDLTPYLKKTQIYAPENLLEEPLECFTINEKIYGISHAFNIDTLVGKASQLGSEPGWTVEEFLGWLEENSKEKAVYGLSKVNVLECCLKGNMDAYVDWEQGKVTFDEASFRNMLLRISRLNTGSGDYYDLYYGEDATQVVLELSQQAGFNDNDERRYHEEAVYIGYPSETGEPRHYFYMNTYSILSRGECKDGAFAFLEYIMKKYDFENSYYLQKDAYEAAAEWSLNATYYDFISEDEYIEVPVVTEELLQKHKDLLQYAVADSLHNQKIRNIVIEEALIFFEGGKTLEETCAVIQSRAQLYVDENM